jgi:sulfur carrier protein ThiS
MLRRAPRIRIELEAHGYAATLVRAGAYELKQSATVAQLLKKAGLRRGAPPLLVMIDGAHVPPEHPLADGDEVRVFPTAAGG